MINMSKLLECEYIEKLHSEILERKYLFSEEKSELKQLSDQKGADKFKKPKKQHDALCDARLNKELYDYLTMV